ncbi:metalloregulator ArsR/SmtB family transcription factor [Paradesulfitobacterium aromaticivorans]
MQNQILVMKSDFFKALAHPTRVRILELLAQGEEVCVCDIITDLGLEQSNVSQHLAILRKQNIITSNKVGLKVLYRIKHPEVLEIFKLAQAVLAQQLKEGQALMRHLADN